MSFPLTGIASVDLPVASFTPTVLVGGVSVTSYLTQGGSYQRVGSKVYFNLYVVVNVEGAGTGSVTIGGLPVAANVSAVPALCSVSADAIDLSSGWVRAYVGAGNMYVTLEVQAFGTPSTVAPLTQVHLRNSAAFLVSGHYQV